MEVVQSTVALNMVLVNDRMWYWISVFPAQCIHTFVIYIFWCFTSSSDSHEEIVWTRLGYHEV